MIFFSWQIETLLLNMNFNIIAQLLHSYHYRNLEEQFNIFSAVKNSST